MAYRRKSPQEKLEELEMKQRQLKERMRRESAKLKAQERKDDTRRKIIAGALALEHKDEAFQTKLSALIHEYVVKDGDRALFGLDPLFDHGANDQAHVSEEADAAEDAVRAATTHRPRSDFPNAAE